MVDSAITVDPQNGKNLLLGGYDFNCLQFDSSIGFDLSRDGGSSWWVHCILPFMRGGLRYSPGVRPIVAYDRKGAAYIGSSFGNRRTHGIVAVEKSTDLIHWSEPIVVLEQPGAVFPYVGWLAADINAGSPWVNHLYASAIMWSRQGHDTQIMVSHSSDDHATWTQTPVDAVQRVPGSDYYTRTAVGKDGTVYVTWLLCPAVGPDVSCGDNVGHMMISKSVDGGNKWSTPRLIYKAGWAPSGLPVSGQGLTLIPVIAVDNSDGRHTGNVYVVMNHWTGTHLQVQVIRSTDGGNTWSQPVLVAPPSATHDQFLPAISVSPTGLVGVSWLDRRNDPANINYQAFAAFSDDGGKTFQKNWQLTQAFSNPNNNGTGFNWIGDFTGNTFAGNDFIAAWMDSSNGFDMQDVVGGVRLK